MENEKYYAFSFHNHSSSSFSSTIARSEARETGTCYSCEYGRIKYQYLAAMVHFIKFKILIEIRDLLSSNPKASLDSFSPSETLSSSQPE